MKSFHQPLSDPDLLSLVRRMELEPKLLRRHLEEQITALVPLEEAWLEVDVREEGHKAADHAEVVVLDRRGDVVADCAD